MGGIRATTNGSTRKRREIDTANSHTECLRVGAEACPEKFEDPVTLAVGSLETGSRLLHSAPSSKSFASEADYGSIRILLPHCLEELRA